MLLNKPTLKIAITDYWDGVIPEQFITYNYLFVLLAKNYSLELSDDPDVLFFSVFGEEHKKYNCLKVLYTGENRKPPSWEYDFSFSFAETDEVNLCLPLFVIYPYFWEFKTQNYNKEIALLRKYPKNDFCNFIYSNDNAKERKEFCLKLMRYKQVACPSKVLNNMPNIGMSGMDKLNFMKNYKFSIAFENESNVNYTTEKIYHPFLVGSIPIYWGNPDISKWFNPASFINCHDYYNFEEVIEKIIEIDNNDALYQSYLNAPPFLKGSKVDLISEEDIIERLDLIAKIALTRKNQPPILRKDISNKFLDIFSPELVNPFFANNLQNLRWLLTISLAAWNYSINYNNSELNNAVDECKQAMSAEFINDLIIKCIGRKLMLYPKDQHLIKNINVSLEPNGHISFLVEYLEN